MIRRVWFIHTRWSSLGPLLRARSLPIIILNALTILQSLCVLVNKIELDFGARQREGFWFFIQISRNICGKKATRTHTTHIGCVSFCVLRPAREVFRSYFLCCSLPHARPNEHFDSPALYLCALNLALCMHHIDVWHLLHHTNMHSRTSGWGRSVFFLFRIHEVHTYDAKSINLRVVIINYKKNAEL